MLDQSIDPSSDLTELRTVLRCNCTDGQGRSYISQNFQSETYGTHLSESRAKVVLGRSRLHLMGEQLKMITRSPALKTAFFFVLDKNANFDFTRLSIFKRHIKFENSSYKMNGVISFVTNLWACFLFNNKTRNGRTQFDTV